MSLCIIKFCQHNINRTQYSLLQIQQVHLYSEAELQKMQSSLTSAMSTHFTDDTVVQDAL